MLYSYHINVFTQHDSELHYRYLNDYLHFNRHVLTNVIDDKYTIIKKEYSYINCDHIYRLLHDILHVTFNESTSNYIVKHIEILKQSQYTHVSRHQDSIDTNNQSVIVYSLGDDRVFNFHTPQQTYTLSVNNNSIVHLLNQDLYEHSTETPSYYSDTYNRLSLVVTVEDVTITSPFQRFNINNNNIRDQFIKQYPIELTLSNITYKVFNSLLDKCVYHILQHY
jgi:hypothetical protein